MDLQERAMLLATSARLTTASADLERMLTGRQPQYKSNLKWAGSLLAKLENRLPIYAQSKFPEMDAINLGTEYYMNLAEMYMQGVLHFSKQTEHNTFVRRCYHMLASGGKQQPLSYRETATLIMLFDRLSTTFLNMRH